MCLAWAIVPLNGCMSVTTELLIQESLLLWDELVLTGTYSAFCYLSSFLYCTKVGSVCVEHC